MNAIGEAFKELDKDGSGDVDYDELEAYMISHDRSTDNLKKIYDEVDKNKNGKIEITEWFVKCQNIY